MLRRDAGILKGYLPPKRKHILFVCCVPLMLCSADEYVVFIAPTRLQSSMFKTILTADKVDHLVRDSTAESLALINILTKISNSPVLLKATVDLAKGKAKEDDGSNVIKRNAVGEALKLLPEHVRPEDVSLSGECPFLFISKDANKIFGYRQIICVGKSTQIVEEGDWIQSYRLVSTYI